MAGGPQKMSRHLELENTSASGVLLLDSCVLAMKKIENPFLFLHHCIFFFSAQCKPESCQSLSQLNFQLSKWPDLFPIPFMLYKVLVTWEEIQSTHSFDWLFQNREKANSISLAGVIKVGTMAKIRSMLQKNIWCNLGTHFCTVTHYDFWREILLRREVGGRRNS